MSIWYRKSPFRAWKRLDMEAHGVRPWEIHQAVVRFGARYRNFEFKAA